MFKVPLNSPTRATLPAASVATASPEDSELGSPPKRWVQRRLRLGANFATKESEDPVLTSERPSMPRVPENLPTTTTLPVASTVSLSCEEDPIKGRASKSRSRAQAG